MVEITTDIRWLRLVSRQAPLGGVNVWAIRNGSGWTVIDTGYSGQDMAEQWSELIARHLDGPVVQIICTHFHPDHIGQIGMLQARYPAAPLFMTAVEWQRAQTMIGGRSAEEAERYGAHLLQCGMDAEAIAAFEAGMRRNSADYTAQLPQSCQIIEAGQTLSIGKTQWRVEIGAGHSPAPALLFNDADKVAIVGDQLLMRITPHVGVDADQPFGDPLGHYLQFLIGAHSIADDVLALPGHGPAFRQAGMRAAEIIAHHEDRLVAVSRALTVPTLCIDTIIPLFGRALSGIGLILGLSEAHAHLNHLVATGRAVRTFDAEGRYLFEAI